MKWAQKQTGFTIVELLIVVVVIAILAAITIVAYNGISTQAKESALKADLKNASTQLHIVKTRTGEFPDNANNLQKSEGTDFIYTSTDDSTFCISASNSTALPGRSFFVNESGSIEEGSCSIDPSQNGDLLQTITNASCPVDEKIMGVDARDNHTYWVQKLADGECWMLTNLAYAGGTDNGGSNTYGDVKTLQNGTSDSAATYTDPKYYIHTSARPTTNPTQPSSSFSSLQYGYLYNLCAAMGAQNGSNGQPSTAACANATTPAPDPSISVCPAGWRLPTGGSGGEFEGLNNAINGGLTNTDAGLRSGWLAQLGGRWSSGFRNQGTYAFYWSSSQASATHAHSFFISSTVDPLYTYGKNSGISVRCVAV